MTFRVGQKVVCVDDTPDFLGRPVVVKKGEVYTVMKLFKWRDAVSLLLEEVSPGDAPGWFSERFRPIVSRKTDISALKALLVPGAKIRETA